MSLESYRKTLESQRERENQYRDNIKYVSGRSNSTPAVDSVNVKSQSKHSGFSKSMIAIIIIAFVLIVAALENPSESESKTMVKDFVVEKIDDKLRSMMLDNNNDAFNQLSAFLGMTFSSKVLDYIADINVSDYVLFSMFDCSIAIGDEKKTIVSGVILFGKIIPLDTDLSDLKKTTGC